MKRKDIKTISDFIAYKEYVGFQESEVISFASLISLFQKYFLFNNYQEFIDFRKEEVSTLNSKKDKKDIFSFIFNKKETIKLNFEKQTIEYKAFCYLFSFFPDIVSNQQSIAHMVKSVNSESDSEYIEKAKDRLEKECFIDERTFNIIKKYSKDFQKSIIEFNPNLKKKETQLKILNF